MRKKTLSWLLAIIALIAVIGFTLAGCGGGGGGGGGGKEPALTGTVTISGTAEVGQTLTADTSSLGGNGTISYHWKRESTNIGTNSNTYVVQAADIGSTIMVTVTRAGYTGSVNSSPTAVVTDPNAPALSGTVSISGTAAVGQTLTAVTTALSGSGTISYQWKRDGDTVIGTNSNTYVVQAADIDSTITVTVTRSSNSGSVTSEPTDVVTDPNAPALTGTVSISGTAAVGQTLTADTTALDGSGDISYQWKRGGDTVIGTNSNTYVVQATDVGETITITVTRSGNSGHVTSDPTDVVTDPSLPALTGTVTISGTAEVGQTLTAITTALGGSGTISYQWKRGGDTVIGTNSNTYQVQAADVGSTITVTVTRAGNSGHVTSDPTAAVPDSSLPALTGTVSISGTAEAGQTLTAVTTALDGSGTISYQWKRGGDTVIGTNSNTYQVTAADVGKTITVTVTRAGYNGSKTSDPTAAVIFPALTGTVSISGSAIAGQTLTAVTTALGGSGDISYQWKRGSSDIGANSNTYAVVAADVGSTITVTVTRSGNSGHVTSDPTAAVIFPALTGTVSISGTAIAGQNLTADTTALGGTGTITYQWKRGGTTDIGENSNTYPVVAADVDFTITVTVTRSDNSGSVTSDPTAVVLATPGTINITVTIGTDAAISNPSIVDGVLTLSRSGSATLTLANSAQYDADSIRWRVQNTAITGSGAMFTLNAANPVYQTGKRYFVTVEAERNGVPYDQTITFTVTE